MRTGAHAQRPTNCALNLVATPGVEFSFSVDGEAPSLIEVAGGL